VSVERLLDPALRDRPVVVGGRKGGRGVVTSASYDVRALGVHSGMPIREASRLAPRAVFVPGHSDAYGRYSSDARAIVERYSPVVRAASIDEQYVDFRGCERLYHRDGDADDDATILRVVREMTSAIDRELGLPASAGIATSKSMAKVACGLAKPRGVLLVPAGAEAGVLAPLPVRKLPGIGPVSEARLARLGIETLGQLLAAPAARLRPIFGVYTEGIRRAAAGLGDAELGRERPAFHEHDPRGEAVGSISNERTFVEGSRAATEAVLCALCERVGARVRKRGLRAGRLTLKLRYADFQTLTRSRTIPPTASERDLHRVALELYRRARTRDLPVRLLGVAASRLELDGDQLELFDGERRRCAAVDRVRERFGHDAVCLATALGRRRRR
jgi:DNA polymerase-4